MFIILLGAPGTGKSTQADVLAQKLSLTHIATGELFRQAMEQKTKLGLEVCAYIEKGMLVPDEITVQMVLDRISAPDCEGGIVLDGFPRNLKQAKALDKALSQEAKAIDKVVYIRVTEVELLRRLSGRWMCRDCSAPYHVVDSPPAVPGKCDKCGGELYQRTDDNIETVKNRLGVYFGATSPLVNYYDTMNKLIDVDGEGNAEEVSQNILSALRTGKLVTG